MIRVVAVDDVNLTVHRGEIFGLLGPNGAGKTTTVESLQGLRPRDSGDVRVLGLDPDREPDRLRRRMGSQLQSSALPGRLHVGRAVALFGALKPTSTSTSTLEEWALTRLRRRPFGALSGGQQQRVFLALALLGDPEVVFLDELTTGLDPHARRSIRDLVRAVRERGATVVLVTHLLEEAEALCDRVAIVDGGRLVALDRPGALVSEHGGQVRVTFTTGGGAGAAFLLDVPGVARVRTTGPVTEVTGAPACSVLVAAALAQHGLTPPDFRTHHPSLDEVFLALTGRALREPVGEGVAR